MYKSTLELVKLQEEYNAGNIKPSPKEGLTINPVIGYHVSDDDILNNIPDIGTLKKIEPMYGKLSRLSQHSPVANLHWDYIFFRDSQIFRPAAIAFEKSVKATRNSNIKPSYTKYLPGTKAYKMFWREEMNRIMNGYEPLIDGKPCGIWIPGEFYFYLNYGWMQKVEFDAEGNVISDKSGLPDFLAMDYYYFKELYARENPLKCGLPRDFKKSLSVAKSRRKGFSYKAAAGAVWCTAFRNKAKVLIASVQGSDATLCFNKALDIIDHLTKYTPFGRKNPGTPKYNGGWKHLNMSKTKDSGYFVFGLVNTKTGERSGRLSEIQTASLFQKPDAASGEGLTRLYFEEAGKISNLREAWTFSLESMRVGSVYRSGIAIIFGTGGSMISKSGDKGSSADFAEIHNNPHPAGVASYDDIYDYRPKNTKCGYFVCDMWSNFGSKVIIDGQTYLGLDENGNACFWVAELALNKERIMKKPPNGKKKDYDKFLTQRCKTPGEAFLIMQGSVFQTEDLFERQTKISTSRLGFAGLRTPGELVEHNGRIDFVPKIDLEPIVSATDDESKEGCLVRYEAPQKINGTIPEGAYIISVDPIGTNTSSGKSRTAIIVYKTPRYEQWIGQEQIVAIYYGRKKERPQEYVQRLLLKLSRYYNAKVTIENDRDGGIPQYFIHKGFSHMLLPYPEVTMGNYIVKSKTALRKFGHSMSTPKHKSVGEQLIYEWLDQRGAAEMYYDEYSGEALRKEGLRNLDKLEDQLLIDELIRYDRAGNYDLVMALMGIVIQLKEWYNPELENIDDINKQTSSELYSWWIDRYGSEEDKLDYLNRSKKI